MNAAVVSRDGWTGATPRNQDGGGRRNWDSEGRSHTGRQDGNEMGKEKEIKERWR